MAKLNLNSNELKDAIEQETIQIEEAENENWLGYEEWQKRDLEGYFEIKENFNDFKEKLQKSISNGVISKILDEIHSDDELDVSVVKEKKEDGLMFSGNYYRYSEDEYLDIRIKDNEIEIYTDHHYSHHGDFDDFVRIQPALNGNTAVMGDPYNFMNDGTGDFSHRILSVGVRGLMTYDDSKPITSAKLKEKLLDGEKNKIDSTAKYDLEMAKIRVMNHLTDNRRLTPEIQEGMRKSTPIRDVSADAPFKVTPVKRGKGSIGE